MNDNGFNFNWRGMTQEPQRPYPYPSPQDGSEQASAGARAAYIASQSANMQGYRPLPDMSGYQPTLSDRELSQDSNRMTQPEIARRQEVAWGLKRQELERELERELENNEKRIEELRQEYETLRREQETATEDMERNIAANRAGIGDTAQYNTWRSRVESRDASKAARKADDEYTRDTALRRARDEVQSAFMALQIARGNVNVAIARQNYNSAVEAYNDLAKKYEAPQMPNIANKGQETYYTASDVDDYVRKHRDKNNEWDSKESLAEAIQMAKSLGGDEGGKYLDEFQKQITQEEGDAQRKKAKRKKDKRMKELKDAAKELNGKASGDYTLKVGDKTYKVTVGPVGAGDSKGVYYNGNLIYEWRL